MGLKQGSTRGSAMAKRASTRLRAVDVQTHDHSSVHVGSHLRGLRLGRGWSIEEAAVKAGLSRNTLGGLETSALPNPTLSTLLALMELYELATIESLFAPEPSRELLRAWVASGRPGTR